MATSPSHRWGQIIGQEFLEVAIEPLMRGIATTHGLYLDQKGTRAARTGKKISWVDLYGNTHDLDFVLERNGSDAKIGFPVAFIGNPDLVNRLRLDEALRDLDATTLYGGGAAGYTDYSAFTESARAATSTHARSIANAS